MKEPVEDQITVNNTDQGNRIINSIKKSKANYKINATVNDITTKANAIRINGLRRQTNKIMPK